MTEDDCDHLVVAYVDHDCVWCKATVPAGQPVELIVAHGDKRWWACEPCARETRLSVTERIAA